MSPASASSDNVGQIGYVIRSPQREQRRPQAPFPKIEEEQEAEDEATDASALSIRKMKFWPRSVSKK